MLKAELAKVKSLKYILITVCKSSTNHTKQLQTLPPYQKYNQTIYKK